MISQIAVTRPSCHRNQPEHLVVKLPPAAGTRPIEIRVKTNLFVVWEGHQMAHELNVVGVIENY